MRLILESSDQDFISVADDVNAINEYVKLQRLNLPEDVQINIESDELIEEYEIPPMFVQPFVENALIHGINSIENGKVSVKYRDEGSKIKVIISDNGKGLADKKSNNELHRSMSSEIIHQRIKNLEKTHNYHINIITEHGNNGTQITLEFPKKM